MDPYVYPNTDVLKNLRNIRDASTLEKFEADATTARILELKEAPVGGKFDTRHLQSIHHHIFQDVYEWAGEVRTVNISKAGNMFAFKDHIVASLDKTLGNLKTERYLTGTNLKRFASRAAYYLGEINANHPFREGNGRAQREFIRQLGARNGYALEWSGISQDRMLAASRQSFSSDQKGLEAILQAALASVKNRQNERDRGDD